MQAVPKSKTPEWGVNSGTESRDANASKNSSAPKAGPKGWRGIGEFQVRFYRPDSIFMVSSVVQSLIACNLSGKTSYVPS